MAYKIALKSPTSPFRVSKNVESCPGIFATTSGMAFEIRSSITPGSCGRFRTDTLYQIDEAHDAEGWDTDVSEKSKC